MRVRGYGILIAAGLLGACAGIPPPAPAGTRLEAPGDCGDWFLHLDAAIEPSGVRDAEAHRLPGFSHLRSNRLLASFADEAVHDRRKFPDWLRAMRELDQRSREVELRNLPSAALQVLRAPDKASVRAETLRCANAALAADLNDPDAAAISRRIASTRQRFVRAANFLGIVRSTCRRI